MQESFAPWEKKMFSGLMDCAKGDMEWGFTNLVSEHIVTSSTVFDLVIANKSWSILIIAVLLAEKKLVYHLCFFWLVLFLLLEVVGDTYCSDHSNVD